MANVVALSKLTKSDFDAYERVRESGKFNMVAQWMFAARAAGLNFDIFNAVQNNYGELAEMYKK